MSVRDAEALVLFAKAPVAGQVKTRLAPALGAERAASLYRGFLGDTLDAMATARRARPSIALHVRRAGVGTFDGIDLHGAIVAQQAEGDLGQRLRRAFEELFAAGAQAVAALGGDSPTLPARVLVQAFEQLDDDSLVLGPSSDGGYYLIAMRRMCGEVFEDIPWSTGDVARRTIEAAARAGRRIVMLPEWYDVDTPDELDRLRQELLSRPDAAPHTRAAMTQMGFGPGKDA